MRENCIRMPLSLSEAEIDEIADPNSHYHRAYVALLWLGKKIEDDQDGLGLHGLALAAYGWMPTILKERDLNHLGPLLTSIVALVRRSTMENAEQLIHALPQSIIRGSWVGTSKILHALNPEVFPIWDSRVAAALGLYRRQLYESRERYLEYTRYAHYRRNDAIVAQVRNAFSERQLAYVPTPIRVVDLVLFHRGKTELNRRKSSAAKPC